MVGIGGLGRFMQIPEIRVTKESNGRSRENRPARPVSRARSSPVPGVVASGE